MAIQNKLKVLHVAAGVAQGRDRLLAAVDAVGSVVRRTVAGALEEYVPIADRLLGRSSVDDETRSLAFDELPPALGLTPQTIATAPALLFQPALGFNAKVTLDQVGHSFQFALSGGTMLGSSGRIKVVQGAGGGFTITSWTVTVGAVRFPGGVPPVLSAAGGAEDILSWYYDGPDVVVTTDGLAFA